MALAGVDAESMKEKAKEALMKPAYDVKELYKDHGIFQHIARHKIFDNGTLAIIGINALWMWVDTDLNTADTLIVAHPIFQIAEHLFCVYFSFEWFCRFMSFKKKRKGLTDGWFCFDSCLVGTMVGETWVMSLFLLYASGGSGGMGNVSILRIARLLRLSRMARMVRLFRAMPELLILMKGVMAAMRSVFFTLCLLMVLLYVFGIAFKQLTAESSLGPAQFHNVLDAMYTLLIDGTLMDNLGGLVRDLGKEAPMTVPLFWLFVLLSALTVLNMLIGVLCEVVSAVAATEREAILIDFVKGKMSAVFIQSDEDGSGYISKEEFRTACEKDDVIVTLHEVEVDVCSLVDQSSEMFPLEEMEDGTMVEKQLRFEELMEWVLQMRGTNVATVKHVMDIQKKINVTSSKTNKALEEIRIQLDLALGHMGVAQDPLRPQSNQRRRPSQILEKPTAHAAWPGSKEESAAWPTSKSPRRDPIEEEQRRHNGLGMSPLAANVVPQARPLSTSETGAPASPQVLAQIGIDVSVLVGRLENIVTEMQCQVHKDVFGGQSEAVAKAVLQTSQDIPWGTNRSGTSGHSARQVPPGNLPDLNKKVADASGGSCTPRNSRGFELSIPGAIEDPQSAMSASVAKPREWLDLEETLQRLLGAVTHARASSQQQQQQSPWRGAPAGAVTAGGP